MCILYLSKTPSGSKNNIYLFFIDFVIFKYRPPNKYFYFKNFYSIFPVSFYFIILFLLNRLLFDICYFISSNACFCIFINKSLIELNRTHEFIEAVVYFILFYFILLNCLFCIIIFFNCLFLYFILFYFILLNCLFLYFILFYFIKLLVFVFYFILFFY